MAVFYGEQLGKSAIVRLGRKHENWEKKGLFCIGNLVYVNVSWKNGETGEKDSLHVGKKIKTLTI